MTTLTPQQILAQLQQIQQGINQAYNAAGLPLPANQVGGSSFQNLNAAQMGGASGTGFETAANQASISQQTQTASEQGRPRSEAGSAAPATMSREQAEFALRGAGLSGLVNASQFAGLSPAEAQRRIQAERQKRVGQVSANTSFAFNPEILQHTQRAVDKFGFALNDVTNTPWEPKEFKDEEAKNTIEVTSKELGSLFQSADQLYDAYNNNQQFRDTLDKFIKKGGSLESVSKNITNPAGSVSIVKDIDNGDGTRTVLYSDGTTGRVQVTKNADGTESYMDLGTGNTQTPDEYLASLANPKADSKAQQMALEELAPESAIAQAEIARVAGISKELQTLYFGDEKTIGTLQMKQAQAEERKRLIEEQERDAKRTVRERAELTVEKNRVEAEQTKAKIEENRLAAKNYMTAQLAKLGALNTTGAAPLALQTLETKYQTQVTKLESAYKFAEREIEIGLEEDIDEIENSADEMVLKIEEDITIDREKSVKEILKARQDAEKEIYRITEQYGRRLRERTTSYTEDLKREAEKFAKEFAKKASNGLDGGLLALEGQYVEGKGVLLPSGKYAKLKLTASQNTEVQSARLISSGADAIRYFVSLPTKFRSLLIQEAQAEGRNFKNLSELKSRYQQLKAEDEADEADDEDEDEDTDLFEVPAT